MSLSIDQFSEFFRALWGYAPFPWQSRLARTVFSKGWPDCIDLPTASGKTACIDVAVFVLACQADRNTNQRTVGRRIFFTVNRRVIVDEAFDRSSKLAEKLLNATDGSLKAVADALRQVSGEEHVPPLDIAQLRGGIYRDRAWARSITQPIVVCTTADQLGSRLLFRGYGVSTSMQPIHAALTACDSLVLLDEAHVTRAFSQTLSLLNRYRQQDMTSPPMRFVQMTATPTGSVTALFSLDDEDRAHPILKVRQCAPKPAELVKTKAKSIVGEIIDRAVKSLSSDRTAIGIIVNRVQTARDTEAGLRAALLKEKTDADVHLIIGRMRPIDRDVLQGQLRNVVGPERPDTLEKPVFVVSTQCLEVGADYDFDALITECASIDALRQRFGRLNRKGRPIDVAATILINEAALKDADPVYGEALQKTWGWLTEGDRKIVDFGISAFERLWELVDTSKRQEMLAPAPDAAVLLPAHLDALCQTAPCPQPSPDVSYFIHGPQRDNAEVNVCWRADLGSSETLWPEIVGLLPPTSPECMSVPLHTVARWMRRQSATNDADVPVRRDEETNDAAERVVLIWRGSDDSAATKNPRDLRPGDTVVIPADAEDSLSLGHVPPSPNGSPKLDVAEQAYEQARRQRVIRVHPAIHPELPAELLGYAASEEWTLPKARIRELLGPHADGFSSGPDEIHYPTLGNTAPGGLLLRFNRLLPNKSTLRPSCDEDDGDGASIESARQVSLDRHSQHVVDCIRKVVVRLHLESSCESLFERVALLHDIGKADIRFQALLGGLTPYEAMGRPTLLAKSGQRGLTPVERDGQHVRAQLPAGFRHEMLSVELIANGAVELDPAIHRDLLLHLIAAHHGHGRPFAPVVMDDAVDESCSIEVNGVTVTSEQRRSWVHSHRLDSGVAERFWRLTHEHGWWGLAWLESILRLADQQASAAEQEGGAE